MKTYLFIFAFTLLSLASYSQKYKFWGSFERDIFYKPIILSDLKIFADTFHYTQDNHWDGKPEIDVKGNFISKCDTAILTYNNKLFAKFVLERGDSFLRMVYPDNNFLLSDTPLPKLAFHRLSSYYKNGKMKTNVFERRVHLSNGELSVYDIQEYDSNEELISQVHYIDGIKNGKELHFYNIILPMDPRYGDRPRHTMVTRTLGKWKNGKKTGIWRIYDDEGNLVRKEHF